MRRIDRYVIASVGKATLLTLVVIATLSYVLTFIDEAGEVGQGGYRLMDVMLVVASMIPRFLYEAFPVAALIGALLALGSMDANRELVALQAAGMSPTQLMVSVFKAGLLLLLLLVLVGDVVGPRLELWGQEYRLQRMNKQVTFRSHYGFWVKDGDAIVNIRRATPGGRLEGVYIYELDGFRRLKRMTLARSGAFEEGRWTLHGVRQSTFGGGRVSTRTMEALAWETVVDPAMLSVALIKPRLQPLWEIHAHLQALRAGGQRAVEYALAFWSKLATPVTMMAMLLLAVPLVTGSHRRVNVSQHILMGAVLGAAFYLASKGFYYAVIVFDLPAVSVALFPVAAFVLAMLVLARARRL